MKILRAGYISGFLLFLAVGFIIIWLGNHTSKELINLFIFWFITSVIFSIFFFYGTYAIVYDDGKMIHSEWLIKRKKFDSRDIISIIRVGENYMGYSRHFMRIKYKDSKGNIKYTKVNTVILKEKDVQEFLKNVIGQNHDIQLDDNYKKLIG